MTLHFIDDKYKRKSFAWKTFNVDHNYKNIASALSSVFEFYELSVSQIAATDNASHFKKAFREFGVQNTEDEDNDDQIAAEADDDFTANQMAFEDEEILLPFRMSCFCHSLSLVAATDVQKSKKLS